MRTIKDTAKRWKVSEIQLWSLIRKGKINSKADGFTVYIDSEEMKQFWDKHPKMLTKFRDFVNSVK